MANAVAMADKRAHIRHYVYVWQFPVRLFHWANTLCVIVLGVTGYLIGNPPALASAAEASSQYWFGNVRFVHFLTAYVWVAVAILRIYWGFVGNEHVRFHNFLPTKKRQWKEIKDVMSMDVLQIWRGATFNVGHNALAGLTYAIMFLIFLVQVFTGFGLYTANSANWFVDLFAWVPPLFGGDHILRIWHHMFMWVFAVFLLLHVYLVAYHDYVEATGTMSSMLGGWKFVRKPAVDEPLYEAPNPDVRLPEEDAGPDVTEDEEIPRE